MNKIRALVCVGTSLFAVTGVASAQMKESEAPQYIKDGRALKPKGLRVVDTTISIWTDAAHKPDKKGTLRDIGWRPSSLQFTVWGASSSENKIVVTWLDGKKTIGVSECDAPDVKDKFNGYDGVYEDQGQVECAIPENSIVYPKPGVFRATIGYKSAETQKVVPLRTIVFKVIRYNGEPGRGRTRYYVDRDPKLAENVAYWHDEALKLRTYVKTSKTTWNLEGKLACKVDGKAFDVKDHSQVHSGNGFEVRSYKGNKESIINWIEVEGSLWLQRGKPTSSKSTPQYKSGKYECKMLADGKVLRTFRFELDKKLRIVPSAEQDVTKPGAIAARSVYLPDVELGKGVDLAYDKAALEDRAFLGRKWLSAR